jgi:hypothetical protein
MTVVARSLSQVPDTETKSTSARFSCWEIATMARFYFHMRTGDRIERDTEGAELPNLEAARTEALLSAREILADAIKAPRQPKLMDCFVIADEKGRELATVSLKEAMPMGWL